VRKPKKLPPEELAPYEWELPESHRRLWGVPAEHEPQPRIDWTAMFGNANPVEIEVGFGKGLFLVTSATARPDTNFFGIEIIKKMQVFAANRIAQKALANVRTCCGDAKFVFRDFVVPGSVQAMHVYFPDPWWKARHKRRTLMTREFAELMLTVLIPGGQFHFATDVADYFEMVTELMLEVPAFSRLETPEETAPSHDMDYLTNFERKFRKEGRPIYRSRYAKLSA
jgi:tRNA (guanine-N7-)-methyltransferase